MFGGGNGVAAGRVHDDHAALGGCLHVHVVHADACAANDAELLGRGEHLAGDLGLTANRNGLDIGDGGKQIGAFQAVTLFNGQPGRLPEHLNATFCNRIANKNFHDAPQSRVLRPKFNHVLRVGGSNRRKDGTRHGHHLPGRALPFPDLSASFGLPDRQGILSRAENPLCFFHVLARHDVNTMAVIIVKQGHDVEPDVLVGIRNDPRDRVHTAPME